MESYFGIARFVSGPFEPISQICSRGLMDEFLRYGTDHDLFTNAEMEEMFWKSLDCRILAKKGSYQSKIFYPKHLK